MRKQRVKHPLTTTTTIRSTCIVPRNSYTNDVRLSPVYNISTQNATRHRYTRTIDAPVVARNGTAWLHFEGAYRETDVYLDGQHVLHHTSGYTSFSLPLPRASTELSIHCNASLGEGWFYEGGGLYRPVHLFQTTDKRHLVHEGVFVSSHVSNPACEAGSDYGGGGSCIAKSAVVTAQVEVINGRSTTAPASSLTLRATIYSPTGVPVAASTAPVPRMEHGATTTLRLPITVTDALLWSIDTPQLYSLTTSLVEESLAGEELHVVDTVNTTFGVRKVRFDADSGMWLND